MDDLFPGESEPIADDPILRGVDLAMSRLIQRDCFTDRTLRVLDELRAEVLSGVRATEPRTCRWTVGPIWKLGGETCVCQLPTGHDGPHECSCGSWFEGCGRPDAEPGDSE